MRERKLTMDAHGSFTVEDDPQGVISTALLVVLSAGGPQEVLDAVAPDGHGVSTQAIGSLERVHDRDELPEPFNEDPNYDPQTQELWFLYREFDFTHRNTASTVLRGDELRTLVNRALQLRSTLDAGRQS